MVYTKQKGGIILKSYVCLFSVVVLWCIIMPTVITARDGQAYLESTEVSEQVTEDKVRVPIYLRVYNAETDTVEEYELEQYTALALSALTDAGLEAEALKAQAVAVRSVVCYRHENPVHEGFELCTDAKHCFALADKAREDCVTAATETEGVGLTYKGKAVLALSHLSSCASTESYFAVYGESIPYLCTVPVEDESGFACYKTVRVLSKEEYESAFSDYSTDFENEAYFENLQFTEGNRVYTVDVGGLCFKGSTFARLFGLPSSLFTIEESKNGFVISCYGNGDGVGMSRLSAHVMAENGADYKSILAHFYRGTELSLICAE